MFGVARNGLHEVGAVARPEERATTVPHVAHRGQGAAAEAGLVVFFFDLPEAPEGLEEVIPDEAEGQPENVEQSKGARPEREPAIWSAVFPGIQYRIDDGARDCSFALRHIEAVFILGV